MMKKPFTLMIVIALTLFILASACNFADRVGSTAAEIEPTETREPTATPTLEPTVTPQPTITPTPVPDYNIGSKMVNPVDGVTIVYVPAGEFLMGSEDEDARGCEKPEHMVYLDAFWIYQHPVTNEAYRKCVEDGGCHTPAVLSHFESSEYADHPVTFVNWHSASDYCEWAGGRLPTEAEWEKAARGTDGRKYPWGNDPLTGERANFCDVNCPMGYAISDMDDGYETTSPVGSYPLGASPYDVLDMAGNVLEWVADWYGTDYYSRSPYENPTGPTSGEYKVTRGGSWLTYEGFLRVSSRYGFDTWSWEELPDTGFRCVHSEAP